METGKHAGSSTPFSGPLTWEGDGHRHEQPQAADQETPPLPVPIPRKGGSVFVETDVTMDGHETLTEPDGKKDSCSGSWQKDLTGSLTVQLKLDGRGRLQSTWNIPHGFASQSCEFDHSLIRPLALIVTAPVAGKIGAKQLVLETNSSEHKTEAGTAGTGDQMEREGRLTRAKKY